MTASTRVAWTERAPSGDRLLLVIDLRLVAGLVVAATLMAAPFAAAPLGHLSSPFALLVVLPPLALALEAFGWRDRLASRLAPIGPAMTRLLATYAVWLVTSASLTLDVAAVAAASVGIAVARDRPAEQRCQVGAAILGSNVGSLLLPFSNLTNLVLVSATGIGFAEYVGLAFWPQLAGALAVGGLLVLRGRGAMSEAIDHDGVGVPGPEPEPGASTTDPSARAAGVIAVAGAAGAIAFGLTGRDMAVPFAISAGLLAGVAVGSGRVGARRLVQSIPVGGLAVVVIAAIASGSMASGADLLPRPDGGTAGLILAMVVGSLLALVANNLPAAAFGAVWLARAHPATVVAFLIGTNVAALATPHGSVATMLARTTGARHGVSLPVGAYVRSAWRYAAIGSLAAMAALILVSR